MIKQNIRWGIVGAGNIANRFATAIGNVDAAELTAVASKSPQKCKEFATKHKIQYAFSSYEELANSDVIDAVYIATVHPLHKPCAELFMNANKHVLCEKPFCVNAKEAIDLQSCSVKNNVFLMEAMWTRFLPAVKEAVHIAKSGYIGDIKAVKADFCYYTKPHEIYRIYANELAGGGLMDVGVYGLHFASMILGNEPVKIDALAEIDYGVDLHTEILIKYDNSAIASVSSAINVAKPETAYIYGTKGFIIVPQFYGANQLIVSMNNQEKMIEKPYLGNGFEEQIIEACNCIREGTIQSEVMSVSESIAILKQMDLIRAKIGLKFAEDM